MEEMLPFSTASGIPAEMSTPAHQGDHRVDNQNHITVPPHTVAVGGHNPKVNPPPVYNGERNSSAVRRWLFAMAYFCQITGMSQNQWVPYAGTFLAGTALDWWQSYLTEQGFPATHLTLSWPEFNALMTARFVPTLSNDLAKDQISTLRQTGSATRYVERFEQIRQSITDFNEASLLHQFVFGLKRELQSHVRLREPKTLRQAQEVAVSVDEILFNHRPMSSSPAHQGPTRPVGLAYPHANRQSGASDHHLTHGQVNANGPFPTPMELGSMQSHGISRNGRPLTCFGCGQPGHVRRDCPRRPRRSPGLYMISGDAGHPDDEPQYNPYKPVNIPTDVNEQFEEPTRRAPVYKAKNE